MATEKRLIDANELTDRLNHTTWMGMGKVLNFIPIDLYRNNKNKEKPVIAVYKNGRTCRFPSERDAARMMCIPATNIVACLKGRIKTAGGCYWKYADDSYGERRSE